MAMMVKAMGVKKSTRLVTMASVMVTWLPMREEVGMAMVMMLAALVLPQSLPSRSRVLHVWAVVQKKPLTLQDVSWWTWAWASSCACCPPTFA